MAPKGSRLCHSPCRNLFFVDHVEDKLTKDQDLAKDSHSGSFSLTPSRNSIPVLAPILIPNSIPILIPPLTPVSSDKLFKEFMNVYLKFNQEFSQSPTE